MVTESGLRRACTGPCRHHPKLSKANPNRAKFGFGRKPILINVDLQKAYTRTDLFKTAYETDPKQLQYVSDLRNIGSGETNFDGVEAVLNDKVPVKTLHMEEGTLVLFRGLNSLHRVTPTIGNRTRILVVLAYNNKADISLSEAARMTFFGRLN